MRANKVLILFLYLKIESSEAPNQPGPNSRWAVRFLRKQTPRSKATEFHSHALCRLMRLYSLSNRLHATYTLLLFTQLKP